MKQQKLFREKIKTEFGGSLLKGKRRDRRPLNFKLPVHLVLKATNSYVLLFNKTEVERLIRKYAVRAGVRIYDCGIHADHIHLSVLTPDRESYVKWIRAVTSVLVQKFTNLKWRLRPYTRIGRWGKAFGRLQLYIRKNRGEGELIVEGHEAVRKFAEWWRRNGPESAQTCGTRPARKPHQRRAHPRDQQPEIPKSTLDRLIM